MRVLIDGDRYPYSLGNATDDDGDPLPWPLVASRLDSIVEQILKNTKCDEYQFYITSDDHSNFRFQTATIRPYKGNRTSPKYFWYEQLRRYLVDKYGARVVYSMEADDALGIEGYANIGEVVIASVDKDLNNIPGWHYDELKEKLYFVKEEDALRNFYCQLLTGDIVDNVPGLYGVGKSSSLLSHIRAEDSECGMFRLVKEQYEKRFGSYWKMFLWENASLLWIKRKLDPQGEKEIHERLTNLDLELSESEVV